MTGLAVSLAYLTLRQRQVLEAMAGGMSQKEAATYLGVHRQTIKNTLGESYRRLGVESQAQAFVALDWLAVR